MIFSTLCLVIFEFLEFDKIIRTKYFCDYQCGFLIFLGFGNACLNFSYFCMSFIYMSAHLDVRLCYQCGFLIFVDFGNACLKFSYFFLSFKYLSTHINVSLCWLFKPHVRACLLDYWQFN